MKTQVDGGGAEGPSEYGGTVGPFIFCIVSGTSGSSGVSGSLSWHPLKIMTLSDTANKIINFFIIY
jgi:hypothetical protein